MSTEKVDAYKLKCDGCGAYLQSPHGNYDEFMLEDGGIRESASCEDWDTDEPANKDCCPDCKWKREEELEAERPGQ